MSKILFLTDHRYHKVFDSVYLLAQFMVKQPGYQVHVASLGTEKNQWVIKNKPETSLWCARPEEYGTQFCYANRDAIFSPQTNAKPLAPVSVEEFDFVFLRILPINIDLMQKIKVLFQNKHLINAPMGIVRTEAKTFLTTFKNHCPEMAICRTADDVHAFAANRPIVVKPQYGYGGTGNILIHPDGSYIGNQQVSQTVLKQVLKERVSQSTPCLAVEFMPRYHKGDKRILVVSGAIVGASLRQPDTKGWLCNISSGGHSTPAEITEEEYSAIKELTPMLHKEGIILYGLDTLEDNNGIRRISELNSYCPGGFHTLHHTLGQTSVMPKTISSLCEYMENHSVENNHSLTTKGVTNKSAMGTTCEVQGETDRETLTTQPATKLGKSISRA